jgi:hypothetical protein
MKTIINTFNSILVANGLENANKKQKVIFCVLMVILVVSVVSNIVGYFYTATKPITL